MQTQRGRKRAGEYYFDYSLVFIVLFLLGFGLIMVYSASSYEASVSEKLGYDAAYYFKKQAVAAVLGLVAMVAMTPLIAIQILGLIYKIKMQKLRKKSQEKHSETEEIIG